MAEMAAEALKIILVRAYLKEKSRVVPYNCLSRKVNRSLDEGQAQ